MDLEAELLVVGGGPVGMAFALAARRLGLQSLLLRSPPTGGDDPRAIALSWGGRLILESLDAWQEDAATAIVEVSVSERAGFGELHFSAEEIDVPALGYVVDYPRVVQGLEQAVARAGLAVREGAEVVGLRDEIGGVTLELAGGERLEAGLAVLAEGGRVGHFQPRVKPYGQTALLARLEGMPHRNRAFERFTSGGPIALLPAGEAWALVWTLSPEEADGVMGLPDAAFLDVLHQRFGLRAGRFRTVGQRAMYPLALKVTDPPVGRCTVAVGNAAQTLHPFAGQGLNLGLRDAWELAGHLAEDGIGLAALHRYEAQRNRDRLPGIAFTDGVLDLFTPPWGRAARGLGLMAMDMAGPLKQGLLRRLVFGGRQG